MPLQTTWVEAHSPNDAREIHAPPVLETLAAVPEHDSLLVHASITTAALLPVLVVVVGEVVTPLLVVAVVELLEDVDDEGL